MGDLGRVLPVGLRGAKGRLQAVGRHRSQEYAVSFCGSIRTSPSSVWPTHHLHQRDLCGFAKMQIPRHQGRDSCSESLGLGPRSACKSVNKNYGLNLCDDAQKKEGRNYYSLYTS